MGNETGAERMKEPFSRNVFQIWKDNGEKLPFFVRRFSWSKNSKFLVTKVKINWSYYKEKGKLYGKAYGHYLNDNRKDKSAELNCAGSYQWELVE